MVNTALAAGPQHQYWSYFQFAKALAELRQGHFSSAADWAQKVLADQRDPNRTLSSYMVLAMAQHHLQQANDSRATLAKGVQFAGEHVRNTQGPIWNDQLIAHILMKEAKALIEPSNTGAGSK